jgi:hypothetical protein
MVLVSDALVALIVILSDSLRRRQLSLHPKREREVRYRTTDVFDISRLFS